jgi:formylglycine-generating enzyme required for sulfatase activity
MTLNNNIGIMIKYKMAQKLSFRLSAILWLCLTVSVASANNVLLSNVILTGQNTSSKHTMIEFTVTWENGWRDIVNWDAAWVFAKYNDGTGNWKHCWLDASDANHVAPPGAVIKTGNTLISGSNRGMGVFIYRNATGNGNTAFTNARVRWNYGDNSIMDNQSVQIKLFALEMVYIPQGNFYAGDGVSDKSIAYGGSMATPLYINNENQISFGVGASFAFYTSAGGVGETGTGGAFSIPAAYPKGHSAFYCMKYEISQKQYMDFLNCLTGLQDGNRFLSNCNTMRNTICGVALARTVSAPDRACNYLNWSDLCAYLDWSGLRPITDLEIEKTCRGHLEPVAYEYAWGSTIIGGISSFNGTDASGSETKNPTTGVVNTNYNTGISGPVRSGIFAATANGGSFIRLNAGATYYGVMEMSGNLWERNVTVGHSTGRLFNGLHGDGAISVNGFADVANWPGLTSGEVTAVAGSGMMGGAWNTSVSQRNQLSISSRAYASYLNNGRDAAYGGRGVRTAP